MTDTQLGFLSGVAFATCYAMLSIPVARWADRGNRVTITSIGIGLWGVTVMGCLLVTNFLQLLIARISAAVGEAGCMPPSYSLLGDYFPRPEERSKAMSIFWLANPLSGLIGFSVGGWLNQVMGWRMTFFILALPGIVLAGLVKLTVRECRTEKSNEAQAAASVPGLSSVFFAVWQQKSTRHLCIAIILFFVMGQGLGQWFGAFLMRAHDLGTTELGLWMGLTFGLGGTLGVTAGGFIVARWLGTDEAKQMRLVAVVVALMLPCSAWFLLAAEKHWAMIALVPWAVVLNFFFGPTFALLQRLVSDRMRATVLAITMLLANLIGLGLGPQIVGLLSDVFGRYLGSDSLRYAMLSISFIALWSAYHFWQVGKTVREDIDRLESGRVAGSPPLNAMA